MRFAHRQTQCLGLRLRVWVCLPDADGQKDKDDRDKCEWKQVVVISRPLYTLPIREGFSARKWGMPHHCARGRATCAGAHTQLQRP